MITRHAASFFVAAGLLVGFLPGCATQRQTGQLLTAIGTGAVIAGAVFAAQGNCNDLYAADPYDQQGNRRPTCSGNANQQRVGAGIAAAGLGASVVGNTLQQEADRLDAWRGVRSRPTPVNAQYTVQQPPLLALPPPPFMLPPAAPSVAPVPATPEPSPSPTPASNAPEPSAAPNATLPSVELPPSTEAPSTTDPDAVP